MIRKVELLAPARNLECAREAVKHGADAVYMGANRFGARSAAGNTLNDIEQAVLYAHRYGARVFITMNTLLFDSELEEAVRMAHELYNVGADALIIQDIRLLYLRRQKVLPPLPIHASTQMDNASGDKVLYLEREGFDRVVLARELAPGQIRQIRENTSLELECFVHGALCVSYSGKCYISQEDCGRSANRGECAQYCRLSYDLEDATGNVLVRNKHLLSLKDLDRSARLQELIDAGVDSFKIEGRLKDVSYVKNITAYYRQQLDRLQGQKTSLGKCTFFFEPDPRKTFHRDQTEYFPENGRFTLPVHQWNTPKSTGEYLGTINRVFPGGFETDALVNTGDGLCFTLPDGTFSGFAVNRVEAKRIFQKGIPLTKGMKIFRNYDRLFDKQLKGKTAERRIDMDIETEARDGVLFLTLLRESLPGEPPVRVTVPLDCVPEQAKDPVQARDFLAATVSRMGNTPYRIRKVVFSPEDFPWFIPASALALAKREALERLEQLVQCSARGFRDTREPGQPEQDPLLALQKAYPSGSFLTAATPIGEQTPLMISRYCLKQTLGYCPRGGKNIPGALQEPLFLVRGQKRFPVTFDCQECLMLVGRAVSSKRVSPQEMKK
jgi:23S rRNA 5-hydroxycytidine C2501 synthase